MSDRLGVTKQGTPSQWRDHIAMVIIIESQDIVLRDRAKRSDFSQTSSLKVNKDATLAFELMII